MLCPRADNYIDGTTFLQLEEQDIRELIPGAIGIVKKLLRLIPKVYSYTRLPHGIAIVFILYTFIAGC